MEEMRAARPGAAFDRILHYSIRAYYVAAAAVFIAAIVLANAWLRRPFLGALFDAALVFTRAASVGEEANWGTSQLGVRAGDQLLSVNGLPVSTSADVGAALSGSAPGESIPVSIREAGGEEAALEATLSTLPRQDRTAYAILPGMLAALFLGVGLWIHGVRGAISSGRAIAILAASLSIVSSTFFDLFTTHALTSAPGIGRCCIA
jgi:hypothetical protein